MMTFTEELRLVAPADNGKGTLYTIEELQTAKQAIWDLGQQKNWFARDTFLANAFDPKFTTDVQRFEQWLVLSGARTPELMTVWSEWIGPTRQLIMVYYRPQTNLVYTRLALGNDAMANVVDRQRALWDIGVREMRTQVPVTSQFLIDKWSQPTSEFKFEIPPDRNGLRWGSRFMPERP